MPQLSRPSMLLAVLAATSALAAAPALAADEPFKVGYVYVSPIGDAGALSRIVAASRDMSASTTMVAR